MNPYEEAYLRAPYPGETSSYPALRAPTQEESDLARYIASEGYEGGIEADPHSALDLPIGPGELASLFKGLAGAGMAGMIKGAARRTTQKWPNAYALRTMEPQEAKWLVDLYKSGAPTDISTSIVSPTAVNSFGDFGKQYGLMFNINDLRAIRAAGPRDIFANMEPVKNAQWQTDFWRQKLKDAGHDTNFLATPGTDPSFNLADLLRQSNLTNESVLTVGNPETTQIAGIRVVPFKSRFFDPTLESIYRDIAQQENLPIFNLPGIDQIYNSAKEGIRADPTNLRRWRDMMEKHPLAGKWKRVGDEYWASPWEDLYK